LKLRIKGNSMRLRLLRTEVDLLAAGKTLSETIIFGPAENASLTYTLSGDAALAAVAVRHSGTEVAVLVPAEEARTWAASSQVGIYASIDIGTRGPLEIMIEKDFACIDRDDADNIDTFPNPNASC
jgi:hypothetical protein